jgi:prevent-host-death family protein
LEERIMPAFKKPSTFTSREFNQDTARAKREAANGPVFITDRGKPALVLMSISEYEKLVQPSTGLSTLFALYDEEAAHIELPIPPRKIEPMCPLDLS